MLTALLLPRVPRPSLAWAGLLMFIEEYSRTMDEKWLLLANKMAEAARAGLAIERERLNEILAERQRASCTCTPKTACCTMTLRHSW
jgi:hypothetical protein